MDDIKKALEFLRTEIENKEKRTILSFEEYCDVLSRKPQRVLRNVFQLFCDMVKTYVRSGEDEYLDDPESIGFIKYDCSKIFIEDSGNPFFADRLFANRFVRQAESLRQGSQQNRIYIYEGPHGCGKSTFLNNLLHAFEKYTGTNEGQSFEIFWDIDINGEKVEISCPSHDYPILIIPKHYRIGFLDRLLFDQKLTEFKHILSHEKEYSWVFEGEVCTICKSLFWALFDKLGSLDKVLAMVKARTYQFDRGLSEGVSVFNPGDKPPGPLQETYLTDKQIQEKIDKIFGASIVKYTFSSHAKTNNGIYVLMDIKSYNKDRLLELHNIISESVHKVNNIEERVNSLFFALMNPEDKKSVEEEKSAESLQGRIQYNTIRYVMEVSTEAEIYRDTFGDHIDTRFLPMVLENFTRVIISSRMNTSSKPLEEWIGDVKKYKKYCDEYGLLLRMEIYGGVIPPWLSEEDRKKFTAKVRRQLIAEAEKEGDHGFSGRESIKLFGDFFSRYDGRPDLINMGNVADFFKHKIGRELRNERIPQNFINPLVNWYDYVVLNEVKKSLYFYNEKQISEDILHYLCAVNYDQGIRVKCKFTGKEIDITTDFLKLLGSFIVGKEMGNQEAVAFAQCIQQKYTEVIAQDPDQEITETELYKELLAAYVKNLKEKALQPFLKNESFREAVKAFGSESFDTFDTRLREHIVYMIANLTDKFGYTEQGAKEICLYVIDRKLSEKFS